MLKNADQTRQTTKKQKNSTRKNIQNIRHLQRANTPPRRTSPDPCGNQRGSSPAAGDARGQ
jgi:hypothetical protein